MNGSGWLHRNASEIKRRRERLPHGTDGTCHQLWQHRRACRSQPCDRLLRSQKLVLKPISMLALQTPVLSSASASQNDVGTRATRHQFQRSHPASGGTVSKEGPQLENKPTYNHPLFGHPASDAASSGSHDEGRRNEGRHHDGRLRSRILLVQSCQSSIRGYQGLPFINDLLEVPGALVSAQQNLDSGIDILILHFEAGFERSKS